MRPLLLTLLPVACAPPPPGPELPAACTADPVATGTFEVGPVRCRAQLMTSGEGRSSDLRFANDRLRAFVRHPNGSLTLPGVGGGGLVDASPWERADRLHEAVPLIDGYPISPDTWEIGEDYVTFSGPRTAWPWATEVPGGRGSYTWRFGPDEAFVSLEGTDQLYLHPKGDLALLDGWLADDRVAIGWDGRIDQDLGGAMWLSGTSRLWVGDTAEVWSERHPNGRHLQGLAPSATEILLFRGDALAGRLRVVDGAFDARIDPNIDGVIAVHDTRAPSPRLPPATDMVLDIGDSGTVSFIPSFQKVPLRPLHASWTDAAGLTRSVVLPAEGATLTLPAGDLVIHVEAGYDVTPIDVRTTVVAGEDVTRTFDVEPAFIVGDIPISLGVASGRDKRARRSEATAVAEAVRRGAMGAVYTAENDVSKLDVGEATQTAWHDDGATLRAPDGWSILAWPWAEDEPIAGRGVVDVRTLTPTQALIAGTNHGQRRSVVDLAWMAAVDAPPWAVEVAPTLVRLTDGDPASWGRWTTWLDAGVPVHPEGPTVWIHVDDRRAWDTPEVERALLRGTLCAGTGPWAHLEAAGVGPGEWSGREPAWIEPFGEVERAPWRLAASVRGRPGDLDRAVIVGPRGRVLGAWDIESLPFTVEIDAITHGWVVLAAWSTTTDHWVVTAPLWTGDPTGR